MNQSKLEVVKQEMARVNVDILGISELKWTGMCEFNSDHPYIYYCGQESLRRNEVGIMVNKSKKQQNDLCSFPRQTIQYQGYAPTSNAEENLQRCCQKFRMCAGAESNFEDRVLGEVEK